MSTLTMTDPTQHIPPESGWIAALIVTLGATLKGLWPWLTKRLKVQAALERDRTEHSQEIEIGKVKAAEAEDRKLIRVLEGQIKAQQAEQTEMRAEVKALRAEVADLRVGQASDKAVIARLEADLARVTGERDRAQADADRLRGEREHYRMIAETATDAVRVADPRAAQQLGDEISAADEATSQAGGKPR